MKSGRALLDQLSEGWLLAILFQVFRTNVTKKVLHLFPPGLSHRPRVKATQMPPAQASSPVTNNRTLQPSLSTTLHPLMSTSQPSATTRKTIKTEPISSGTAIAQIIDHGVAVVSTPHLPHIVDHPPLTPAQIKREKVESRALNGVEVGRRGVQAASFPLVHPPSSMATHSSSSSSSSFPLIQTTSLLKCPAPHCGYCSLSIPDIQVHIASCRPPSSASAPAPVVHVDIKDSNLGVKGEVKREDAVDPLAKKEVEEQPALEEVVDDSDEVESISSTTSSPSCCPEPSCNYTTTSLSSLQAHAIMHQRKAILQAAGRSVCPVCRDDFGNLATLKKHVEDTHGERRDRTIVCGLQDCGKVIDGPQFYRHVLHNHYGSKYKLKCDQCDYRATTTTHLRNHLMKHLDERPHKCDDCDKAFRTRPQLVEHQAVSHRDLEEESCDKCEKKFASKGKLAKHKQTQHSEQTHKCPECEKAFSTKAGLKSHERRVHRGEEGGEGSSLCPECGLGGTVCKCGKASTSTACPVCGKQVHGKERNIFLLVHPKGVCRQKV